MGGEVKKNFGLLCGITAAISYAHLPATVDFLTRLTSASLVGITTWTAGLAVAVLNGIATGIVYGVMGGIAGGAIGTVIPEKLRKGYYAFDVAAMGGSVVCVVGGIWGAIVGLGSTYGFIQNYFQNLLSKENDPQTSSFNICFQQSATPLLKELQAKLKEEKGLVLDIPSRVSAPKLSLA